MSVEPGGSGAPMSERMQSLLSRAVEDQLSEQRQIAGVLTDLRAQLQRITADVGALREESRSGDGSDAALSTVSADVREAVRLLGERIDGVARLVQQRGSDLAELRGLLEQMHAALRGQGEALAGVTSGLGALPAFGERIGGLQDNLTALQQRLGSLDGVAETIAPLQQRVDAVDQGLRDLRSAFAAIGARMAELPGRGDLDASAQRSSAQLADRLAGVESSISALSAQVAAATTAEDGGADGDDTADEVAALRAELARFATATTEETHQLADRLTALDDRVGEVLEAVTAQEPAEPEHADDEAEDGEDPVLAELADLREALLGEGGLAARLDASQDDDLDQRVAAAVDQAVAASEERLTAHIDEAVLALAEALLRRRRPSGPAPVSTPAAPAAATVLPGVGEDADDEEYADESDDDESGVDDQPEEPSDGAETTPAWQTPQREPEPPSTPSGSGDANRRRRPWWRPGD